jgi:PAS domain S-box-containing protein
MGASLSIDLDQLVAAAGDAIIASDISGAIVLWNAAAQRIFGFSAAEALGQSLDLIIPERQRQRHWDGYDKTMRTGQTRYGADLLRVPALSKDCRPLSIAFSVALLHDADGKVSAIVAIVRDETTRWAEERQMRFRLAQLEAAAKKAGSQPARVST